MMAAEATRRLLFLHGEQPHHPLFGPSARHEKVAFSYLRVKQNEAKCASDQKSPSRQGILAESPTAWDQGSMRFHQQCRVLEPESSAAIFAIELRRDGAPFPPLPSHCISISCL